MALSLGDTIQELQFRMSDREFRTWCAFRKKYGPMNPVRMYDRGAAIIASQISNAFGQKTSPNDFIPYGKETDKNDELDGEELITALMSTGRAKIGR